MSRFWEYQDYCNANYTAADIEEGLTDRAAKALGFKMKCQCGHENGLHNTTGDCAVLGCECKSFHPYCKPDQSCCDFCCGN